MSDKKIMAAIEGENIVIEPFDKRNLATSSYDVTLGEFYYQPTEFDGEQTVYNIYDKKQTLHHWGEVKQAVRADKSDLIIPGEGISMKDKVILIAPFETILAHTNEFIGGRGHITTMMKARSSMGRQGIAVCKCAGWGDVGYINRWTMEITNFTNYYVPLVVGRRIAQIVFFETGEILGGNYTEKGKYQISDVLATLKRDWRPEDMLPKLWKDRDITK